MRRSKTVEEAVNKALKDGTATETAVNPGAYIRTPGPAAKGLVPVFKNEAEFTAEVLIAAKLRGWRTAHFRTVRVQRKGGGCYYETPVQGDGKGFLDLELVRSPRLLKIELKMPGNSATPEQCAWADAYEGVPGVEVHLFYPKDWETLLEVLK